MKIIKKTTVKQIVTENSKGYLRESFKQRKMRLEQESQQLLFERRKLQNKPGFSKQDVHHRFQGELNKRQEEMELLAFKEEQLELLEVGSEIVEGEVESLVEVGIGDNWKQLMENETIVIKDNIVVRIDK